MHDPDTLVCAVNLPWFYSDKLANNTVCTPWWRNGPELFQIWHRDPCKGPGGDDSCGWSSPRISSEECEKIADIALDAYKCFKNFECKMGHVQIAFHMLHTMMWQMKGKKAGPKEAHLALDLTSSPVDNLCTGLEFWNVNSERFIGTCINLWRCYLRYNRPWWKHPRWHLHHWTINLCILRMIRRWAVDRCNVCGKRLGWTCSVCSDAGWGQPNVRPHWWSSTTSLHHCSCRPDAKSPDK